MGCSPLLAGQHDESSFTTGDCLWLKRLPMVSGAHPMAGLRKLGHNDIMTLIRRYEETLIDFSHHRRLNTDNK